jgi:hypothetical protein
MRSIRGGINQMATKDGFQPDRSPIFLSEHEEETEQPDIGKAWDVATISSRILKTSIVAVTVTAIGIAILSIGNPVELVANVTDWWVDKPALQTVADPSTATIQSVASTQDSPPTTTDAPNLPPTTTDAPTREEIAAAVEPADQSQAEQSQAEVNQPFTEALFKQFQAWAEEQETRAKVESPQPVQAAPVKVVQDAPAQVRPTKKHRRVRSVQNARAEVRPQRNHRARAREEQDARAQVPPVADPRAQDQSVQNAQTPSLLQSLGLRN